MLYDRIKWHYDKNVQWVDEDAARSFIPAITGALRASSGFRYDLTDHAEFQRPDPQWKPPPGLKGMVVRCTDGIYREPAFATDFRIMDGLLRAGELDYCMWYVLPNPNVSNQQMLDAIAGQLRDSGVTWGHPGHGISIDDEPTPYHGQLTGQRMIDLHNALHDLYGREELHYVGLYSGNYGFIANQGWQLWAPWPSSNGALPSWTTNLVMQQWGVAAAGEVSGFPTRPVDVDHIWDAATLDALTGRIPTDEWETFFVANQDTMNAMAEFLRLHGTGGQYDMRDACNNAAANHATLGTMADQLTGVVGTVQATHWQTGNMQVVAGTEGDTIASRVIRIEDELGKLSTAGIDVDKLAEALAPKLNSDPKAVARALLEALGTLATGGTPGGGAS